jgi:hypothetical protein
MEAYNVISLPVNKLNVSSPEGDDKKLLDFHIQSNIGNYAIRSSLRILTNKSGDLPILLGTDVPLRFSKYPPFIYSVFLKTIPIHIFPLKILTQSYIS